MEKNEKILHNPNHKCQICSKQTNLDCTFTDVVHYSSETGNFCMTSKLACLRCKQQIHSIRHYVQQNGLNYSKNSLLFKENIEPYIPKESTVSISDENSIYQKYIQQQIRRNKLYHCTNLPQNWLQLVYYSSFSINNAERHERVRNTIGQVMHVSSIPFGNLEDIAILVHCLSCYMHYNNIIALLKHISQKILLQGSPIFPSHFDCCELPTDRIWRELYSECYVGNLIIIIGILLRDWRNFNQHFEKLRQQRQYLKKQQLTTILSLNLLSFTFKQKITYNELENNNNGQEQRHNGCKQCSKSRLMLLVNEAKTKNSFTLLLQTILKQDCVLREHILQVQTKFLKEKQEFIKKIIKLNNKIDTLQQSNNEPKIYQTRQLLNQKLNDKLDCSESLQKSQNTNKINEQTVQFPQKAKQTNINITQNEKNNEEDGKQNYLKKIVVNIPEFNPSFLSQEVSNKFLAQVIENSIIKMKDDILNLQKKSRTLENQSKRLLSILTRKEQRFVPLIHQKDEIIEKYENALWRMEHRLAVQDPLLAPRIESIIQIFKDDFMEKKKTGIPELKKKIRQQHNSSSSSKKKSNKKQKQIKRNEEKQMKQKNGNKECMIF